MAAISILSDAVFTIQGTTGGDDGVTVNRTLSGQPITFKADKVTCSFQRRTEDHSTAQDGAELHRIVKMPQAATVETKLQKGTNTLLDLLVSVPGTVVVFTATATGASLEAEYAIIDEIEWEYAGPSTLRFTLKQYGSVWVVS